jgi:hypothetical protein
LSESQGVESEVGSRFQVADKFFLSDGEMEFRVKYDSGSKARFDELFRALKPSGYYPVMQGTPEDCSLFIRKKQEPKASASRIPMLLLLLSLTSVIVFSLLLEAIYSDFAPGLPGYVVLLEYGFCVIAVVGAYEAGHILMARRRGEAPAVPYFIPGIPDITAGLPTLGPISSQREPFLNRDSVVLVSLAGPLAVLVVSVLAYVFSNFATVVSSVPLQGNILVGPTFSVPVSNPSVIQALIDWAVSPFVAAPPAGYVLLSPISDASSVGFLLVFVSLLPMALFDGGRIASAAFGQRAARVATYASFLLLLVLDTWTYWGIAIVVLLMGGRAASVPVLDEVSGVSRVLRVAYVVALLLAFLSLPIPHNFATVPLP